MDRQGFDSVRLRSLRLGPLLLAGTVRAAARCRRLGQRPPQEPAGGVAAHTAARRGRLLVLLSYGRASYARAPVDAGRAALSGRFDPLTDWMPIGAYNTRIASYGFVFMNLRRQQALGNICVALPAYTCDARTPGSDS